MKTKLFLMCVMAASAVYSGVAMPTEAEVEKAVPKVERMLASEKVALASGKMTRAEVAAAAMRLAADADDEAAKLLLMKGAFILHVKDGDLEKAVKTMNAFETAIADMPPQIVTNIIETALLGLPNKAANGARLYRLLDEAKIVAKVAVADGENLKAVVGGYTWTYRVKNGEAEIVAEKDRKPCCAVSPKPTGHVAIPSALGEVKVTGIGCHAFHYCEGIASVAIPTSVTNIDRGAFWRCSSLKSVTIPSGVRSIGRGAFWRCQGLSTVKIPASVENIGEGAFSDCYCLKHINVEVGNQWFASVDGVLYTKDLKELVMCPNALSAMKILPDVRFIWQWASDSCSKLESVSIPEKVTNIGKEAFEGCEKLTFVTMLGELPSAPNDIFRGCANLKSIHVPANAKSWAGMTEWQGIPLVFDAK